MKFYTQNISGNIGNTPYTIKKFGCKGTCYAMILETDPHNIFNHAEYFDKDGLLIDDLKCALDFGGKWDARRDIALHDPVVCETRYTFKDGAKGLHFILRYQGRIYDPLSSDGTPLQNYPILSYRNIWKESEDNMEWYKDPSTNEVYKYDPDFDEYYSIGDPNKVPWDKVKNVRPPGTYLVPYKPTDNSALDQCNKDKENLINGSKDKQNQIDTLTQSKDGLQKQLGEKLTEIVDLKKKLIDCENKPNVPQESLWSKIKALFNKLIGKE